MKQDHIDYSKILTVIESIISSSSFYWQSLSLIFCFIISYIFYNLAKKFFFVQVIAKTIKKNSGLTHINAKYLTPLLYPTSAMLFVALGFSIYSQFFKETILFSTTLKLLTLFIFLRFLRISSNSTFVANAAGIFLMPTLILDIFGLLDSTIEYLDQYAFEIGNIRVSIYLVIKAFISLLIIFWLSNLIRKKSKYYIDSSKEIKSSTKNIISKLIDIVIYSTIIITLFKIFGVDMTTIAVIGGAVGVGIGFGLQKIASNFISGLILLLEKSVEIGDIVELDGRNIFGTVKHFGGRYTLLECPDGREMMIPNEDFIINKVTNWTYSNSRARIEINIGVAYKSDMEKVKEIMINCAKENSRCLSYPEVECFIDEFGEFSVKFTLLFWISDITAGRSATKSEVMMNILKQFKESDIEIPVLQRININEQLGNL